MKQRIDILSARQVPRPNTFARLCGWSVAALLACGLGLALAQPAHPFPWEESLEPRSNNPDLPFVYGWKYDPVKYKQCMESAPPGMPKIQSYYQCEEYRQKIPKFDPSRRDLFGEQFDLQKYGACKNRVASNDSACDMWAVYRRHEPEFWPYPEVPRPKWPEPPTVQTYQPGMTTDQYYKALCEKEAGVWVYRKVEGIKGIYVIRPRFSATSEELRDRFVMEDPYGYEGDGPLVYTGTTRGYDFVEYPTNTRRLVTEASSRFVRYTADASDTINVKFKREEISTLNSRYGFTWRGLRRPMDRELGISGGEMMIVDLRTGEVLALRRGFLLGGNANVVRWERLTACPQASYTGRAKDFAFTDWFLSSVLNRTERKE